MTFYERHPRAIPYIEPQTRKTFDARLESAKATVDLIKDVLGGRAINHTPTKLTPPLVEHLDRVPTICAAISRPHMVELIRDLGFDTVLVHDSPTTALKGHGEAVAERTYALHFPDTGLLIETNPAFTQSDAFSNSILPLAPVKAGTSDTIELVLPGKRQEPIKKVFGIKELDREGLGLDPSL